VAIGASRPARAGVEIDVRLSLEHPVGTVRDDRPMSDFAGIAPGVGVSAGYRFAFPVLVGAYFLTRFPTKGDCEETVCRGSVASNGYGVMADIAFGPLGPAFPWAGLGVGVENLTVGSEGGGGGMQGEYTYFSLSAHVEGGADFAVSPHVRLGPWLRISAGRYSSTSSECRSNDGGESCEPFVYTGDIEDTAWHAWPGGGVRVLFVLDPPPTRE